MSPRLGGRYDVVREIGSHDTVHVYQAIDTQSGSPVLIKTMLAATPDDIDDFIRFQQEGVVLSTLKHPNIWEIKGTFLEEQTTCIVMEAVEGRALSEILASERLTLDRVKAIMRQVVAALVHAHAKTVIHRDINPDNIVVMNGDRVKVRAMRELGMARIVRPGSPTLMLLNVSGDSPLYMAPEQLSGGTVDGRTDIYSLGAVLYHLVTGRPPFEGDDPNDLRYRQLHTAPTPPSRLNPDLPEDWEALILTMLAKDPAQRFQTAPALEAALKSLSEDGKRTTRSGRDAEDNRQAGAMLRCSNCGREGRGKFCGSCGSRLTPA